MVESSSRVSKTTQNLQTQLFNALLIQTLIPAVLMYFPVSVMFIFTFLNIDLGKMSGIATITIAVYPAIDPLPNIIIIRHYRQAVWEFILKILGRKMTVILRKSNHSVPKTTSFQMTTY
uniref:G_PROTEIN_RECEP_F1_2 domain-containing protein n=1 Tax=Caenorhabditis tropicalis TaxID=1561998 RepID=A0A1I7V0A7_9PELO